MPKRCFIAINLPNVARWELEALVAELSKINGNSQIRFTDPKQIHLTLNFLGDLTEDQIEQVKEILGLIVTKYGQTEFITQEIGAFPDLKQPNIIFLKVKEPNGRILSTIQTQIGKELEKIGIKTDQRPWMPHLTLARLTAPGRFKTDGIQPYELTIPAQSVELMESELNSEGPVYKIIESYKLK